MLEDLEKAVVLLMKIMNMENIPTESILRPGHKLQLDEPIDKNESWNEEPPTQDTARTQPPATPLRNFPPPAGTTPPRSILKRKSRHAPTPSSTPSMGTVKRVRTTDFATISPDTLTYSDTSPLKAKRSPNSSNALTFSNASPPRVHYHREVTRQKGGRKWSFHRGRKSYMPGLWASPAFSEKANTSFSGVGWDELEKIVDREEKERKEEEDMLREGLKVVSGAWVLAWWIQHVV
ncbi:hypothetical protein P280DRAFT_474788 [Massarina eburnea CBS 473.64]|uniref:Uncharacterized protein n=1 Tax=Massarina eburnea CBS 473.64 TaxID=1395130 RepID=A0A6A6RFM4_9PLEO|nr:hypothetical protein P280DRAFT_474788 [Massarina eburnea CBS 473.64]